MGDIPPSAALFTFIFLYLTLIFFYQYIPNKPWVYSKIVDVDVTVKNKKRNL
jgi:hypothetical protein